MESPEMIFSSFSRRGSRKKEGQTGGGRDPEKKRHDEVEKRRHGRPRSPSGGRYGGKRDKGKE